MKTELVHRPSMLLGGVGFYGDPFRQKAGWDAENEIGKTCDRFTAYVAEHPVRPYACGVPCFYEVHVYGAETATKGYFEVFVGEEVNTAELPTALSAKFFPASDYLRITLSGEEISGDWWRTLDTELIPAYGVRRGAQFIIQAYDGRFKGMDRLAESTMEAYIPVETA
jgi:hypothetical protein